MFLYNDCVSKLRLAVKIKDEYFLTLGFSRVSVDTAINVLGYRIVDENEIKKITIKSTKGYLTNSNADCEIKSVEKLKAGRVQVVNIG